MTLIRFLARHGLTAIRHPRILTLGYREGWSDLGMTYDDSPWSARSVAYDVGRTLRRRDWKWDA